MSFIIQKFFIIKPKKYILKLKQRLNLYRNEHNLFKYKKIEILYY